MSEQASREDFKIAALLDDPEQSGLFDRGSIVGEQCEPILETTGSFADEVTARIEAFSGGLPEREAIVRKPAFILGVISSVSARREAIRDEAMVASFRGPELSV